MPSKRRKVSESADVSTPSKRVTRSCSKPATSIPEEGKLKASKPTTATAKGTKAPLSKPQPKTTEEKPKKKENTDPPQSSDAHATLTIHHDSVKNPITCHQYNPSSEASTAAQVLIFTHGAGGTLSAPAVENFCTGYSTKAPVLAFQGSMNLNSRVKAFHACIAHSNEEQTGEKLVLGGRSMGARAAVIAATEYLASETASEADVWLVLVSYPLKGPKDDIRDQILLNLPSSIRVLFVIGERDSMCPLDLLKNIRGKMSAKSQLVIVRDADHGMHVKPAAAERRFGEETGGQAAAWVAGELGEEEVYIGDDE